MKFLERVRFLIDKKYSMWHIARMAQHTQWKPTQPITARDVEQNIDLYPTLQIKALPKIPLRGNLDGFGNLDLSVPAEYNTEPMRRVTAHLDVLRLRDEQ